MTSILKTKSNKIVSSRIREYSTSPNMTKVTNTLLDGSIHVQSFGSPNYTVSISCDLNLSQKRILEDAYIRDEPLIFESEGKYYEGLLQDSPAIENHIVNMRTKKYVASIIIISQGENIITIEEGD